MNQKPMRPRKAWAIVTKYHGAMAVVGGQCPIYWLRHVAKAECARWNEGGDSFRVVRVLIGPPPPSEG
jgi:hypothetical protein